MGQGSVVMPKSTYTAPLVHLSKCLLASLFLGEFGSRTEPLVYGLVCSRHLSRIHQKDSVTE